MAGIWLPSTLVIQPQGFVKPNLDFLRAPPYILLNPGSGNVDSVTGRTWTRAGSIAIGAKKNGLAYNLAAATHDHLTFSGYPEMTGNVGTLALWLPSVGAASTNGHVYLGSNTPNALYFQVTAPRNVAVFGSQSVGTVSTWFNTTNRSIVFSSVGTAATLKVFIDGVDTGLTFSAAPTACGAGNKNLMFGGYPAGTTWDVNGSISHAVLASTPWDARMAAAFHANPNIIYEDEQTFIPLGGWVPASITAGYTGLSSTSWQPTATLA